ncbi:unnamed protein product, partial [Heterobilharzia americana]
MRVNLICGDSLAFKSCIIFRHVFPMFWFERCQQLDLSIQEEITSGVYNVVLSTQHRPKFSDQVLSVPVKMSHFKKTFLMNNIQVEGKIPV